MHLEIKDPDNLLDNKFIIWLKTKIRNKILADLDTDKLIKWDNYFNDNPVYKSIYKKQIQSIDIITAGASNLIHSDQDELINICINPNVYTPGLDRIKLLTICKLINYGNQELSGYPIFTNTFEYFSDNIQKYVNLYLIGVL